ncbi:hypothetical protein RZO55_19885 [Clostridium boliviensis]|uniref:Uncharacterized protein n=1 Tax=Clostridium boliviensis TaxID=318465 RepID=A0ABU4GQG7_9CLOT|nr:hypothetical protein [Clostridium boliviensis]MDW2799834.1 hypothetical protein [Clostridium boliviensis]
MMSRDMEILKTYKPVIMQDTKEPFSITAMGCTVFRETKRSSSFPRREIVVNREEMAFAIEYAIWYDYDIQHLYELEHVWVYVDHEGAVKKVEASFHGKFLNIVDLEHGELILEGDTHPIVYAQPGKHAMLPDPRLVRIIPDWLESCLIKAGTDGVLVQDMFEDQIHTDDKLQIMTEEYIKEVFGFCPSLEFQPFYLEDEKMMSWEELKESIPQRVNRQIDIIKAYYNIEK